MAVGPPRLLNLHVSTYDSPEHRWAISCHGELLRSLVLSIAYTCVYCRKVIGRRAWISLAYCWTVQRMNLAQCCESSLKTCSTPSHSTFSSR